MLVDLDKITKAKEKLGDSNADIIADLLMIEKWDPKNKKGCCPFHNESTPSFIYNAKRMAFKCFGCSKNVDIIDAFMHTGLSYMESVKRLFEEAKIPYSFGELGVKTQSQYRYPHEEPINEKTNVYKYMQMRGISSSTVDVADVREDSHGNCVFNYYDTNDVLTMVKYRPSHKIDKSAGEIKNWCQKDSDTTPLLFNMNKVNVTEPLLITEGEMDTLAAIESGWTNSVSVPLGSQNFHWIEQNYEWLEQFNEIIICSDNDEAGTKMRKECVPRLGSWRTKYIEIPHTVVNSRTGNDVNIKDLNEVLYYCGKDKVLDLIANAQDPGVPSVMNISEVNDIDIDEMDGITTGIHQLDSEIMKLFYGTLTVVSGLPGSGKTSFLSQLMCQSLEQDKPTMMFSREMPCWMQKSWLNYIMAGPNNIKEYCDESGAKYYKVTQSAKRNINEAYDKKWFLYRDEWSNKLDDILLSMEDCVKKYGVKLVILDNLMTIDLGTNENNELVKQTECINRLIKFAMQYSISVVLVAHPRKMPRDVDVGMYDISGTANIINLAHRTLGLRRIVKDQENSNYDVMLTVIKDRMRGKAGMKINMYYDIPTRRFYTNESEYNYSYVWDTSDHQDCPYPHSEEYEIYGDSNKR